MENRADRFGRDAGEDLRRINESEAFEILHEWGYEDNPPSEK